MEDHSTDEEDWSSGIEDLDTSEPESDEEHSVSGPSSEDEVEDLYERRALRPVETETGPILARLPVKLRDGTVKQMPARPVLAAPDPSTEEGEYGSDFDDVAESEMAMEQPSEDPSSGSRRDRIRLAQEEIATLCQDIVVDPENSVRGSTCPIFIPY